ncbi:MAG: hypothetical protein WBR24_21580 [Desulfobacterales bacterium]
MKPVGSKTIPLAFCFGFMFVILLSGCGGGDNNSTSSPVSNSVTTIFLAKENNSTATELYGSTLDGASIVKLSGNLVSGGNVVDFAISPDGRFVAYLADQEEKGKVELYTVPVGGGTVINISRQSGTILEVKEFAWAPNSSRVAFRAFNPFTGNTGGNTELFTNITSGNGVVTVSNFLPVGANVDTFEWSPTSQLIAYTANTIVGSVRQFRLFAAPPNQENRAFPISNIPAATNTYTIGEYQWAPNGSIVAFLADINILGVNELLVVLPDLNSSNPVAISGTLADGGEVVDFSWAPNNSRIAYLADQFEDEKFDLITVVPDVNSLIPNPEPRLVSGNIIGDVIDFAWSPDSSRLAYIADGDTLDVFELYTNVPFGTSQFKVSGDLKGGEVSAFAWAPDSSLIAYQASQDSPNIFELFTSRPFNPIDNVKISGSITSGGLRDFAAFGWAPDNSRVAYIARQETDFFELYSSTPDGGDNSVVSGKLVAGGNVDSFKWSPDSSRVAYRADQETINVPELYSSQPDGSDNLKISSGKVEDIYNWVP